MTEYVTVDVTDGVARVTLDHPELRNALTRSVADELREAMRIVDDSSARCILLEGSGPAFCAGGDVNAMVEGANGEAPAPEEVERVVNQTAGAVRAVADCRLPTIAAVDGAAYGAGASLAVACDIILASEDAQISFGFRRLGLAVDSGASYFLPRIVGESVAKELVYTGDLVDAQRARDLGLFSRVFTEESFDEEVTGFVRNVADGPTVALTESKRLLEQGATSSLDDAIGNERTAQVVAASTEDHAEGVRAFRERREPEFRGE